MTPVDSDILPPTFRGQFDEKNNAARCAEITDRGRRCRRNGTRSCRACRRPHKPPAFTSSHRLVGHALGQGLRRPAHRRSRRRHVPQSGVLGRSSRPHHPQGRRRLLDDVLVVRLVSRHRRLAFARPRELECRRPGADQARGLGVGLRHRQTWRTLLTSTSRRAPPTEAL